MTRPRYRAELAQLRWNLAKRQGTVTAEKWCWLVAWNAKANEENHEKATIPSA